MKAKILIEGGASGNDSKQQQIECRQGFRQLLGNLGLSRLPELAACGSRENTFKRFKSAHKNATPGDYIAMLVDSEDPVADIEKPWQHLTWEQPSGVTDDQALLMTTSMETWIAADREALREHYGDKLSEKALPSQQNMESRGRQDIFDNLRKATRQCKIPYAKGKESFLILGKLDPRELEKHLPSFVRCRRILKEKLT
ncbi:MAG: DUF4276 family protein [Pirellulaceae bacterium]